MSRHDELQADEIILKRMIESHFIHTGSMTARQLMDDWPGARTKFVKVFPMEYRRALVDLDAQRSVQETQGVTA